MSDSRFNDVRRFSSIDSTNRYLLDEARAGAPEGVVAVADHQTAGRGRLGRSWEAPPGANLLMSVLLRPDLPADERHLVTAAVALAACDAIESLPRELALAGLVKIKWPNDLVDRTGHKLAGVLAEADLTATAGGPPPVVVGIGINVNWPGPNDDLPPELASTATSLRLQAAGGGEVDREMVLAGVLTELELRVAALADPTGRQGLASDLAAQCTTIGASVRVDLPDGSFEGLATGLTPEGHLVVDVDGAPRTVVAGDVVHVRPRV